MTTTWLRAEDCRLGEFHELTAQRTALADYPHAERTEREVLIYDSERLRGVLDHGASDHGTSDQAAVRAELARALLDGPGIIVIKRAFAGPVVDQVTAAFGALIEEQRAAGVTRGDHFAKPGANDRVWGALDKLAVRDPEVFADYYANDMLALAARAWLGPGYQVTSQVNVVNRSCH